ncbi:hypothetical protein CAUPRSCDRAFT_11721 [Caulochytrium protostelioides]|uniref:Uncharacterized protein n=1 Tax=Caulochytrium protostelioides TaxID=1555241 RepID=A0A4P9WTH3_9FUNG|nr:hypothetical protein CAUPRSCDRAFT_11721 [Caulochytrium protostelioides]
MTRLAWALCHMWLLILAATVCIPSPTVLGKELYPRTHNKDRAEDTIRRWWNFNAFGTTHRYSWDDRHRVLNLPTGDLFECPWSDRLTKRVILNLIQNLYHPLFSDRLAARLLLNRYKLHRDNLKTLTALTVNNDDPRMQELHHYQAAVFLSQLPIPEWFRLPCKPSEPDPRLNWEKYPTKFTFLNDPQHPETVKIILKYLKVPGKNMGTYLSKGTRETPDEKESRAKAFENLFEVYRSLSFEPDNELLKQIHDQANMSAETPMPCW